MRVILIFGLALLAPALSATTTVDEVYCEGFDGNMRVACYQDLIEQEDKRLHTTLKSLLKTLTPQTASNVREAQKQWEEFRDRDCEAQRSMRGAEDDQSLDIICPAVKTKIRADELAQLLSEARAAREARREKAARRN